MIFAWSKKLSCHCILVQVSRKKSNRKHVNWGYLKTKWMTCTDICALNKAVVELYYQIHFIDFMNMQKHVNQRVDKCYIVKPEYPLLTGFIANPSVK